MRRWRLGSFALALVAAIGCPPRPPQPEKPQALIAPRELRVCADPNNLPFSNLIEQGFENALARLLAEELHASLRYVWRPQGRGSSQRVLDAGECDVVMGVPANDPPVLTTAPYYRSIYVFVYRTDREYGLHSLDDAQRRRLRIGIQRVALPGCDECDVPGPPARLIEAVARGEVDVAIAWGPVAGYFAPRARVPLEVVPVAPQVGLTFPRALDIAMGVRPSDSGLRDELDGVIERRRGEIDALLRAFGVPRVDAFAGAS